MRVQRNRRAPKGSWKMQCDLTGTVYYSPEMTKQWNNLWVGRDVYEPRNPQDFPIITKERNMVGLHPLVPSPGTEPVPNLPPFDYGFNDEEGFDA